MSPITFTGSNIVFGDGQPQYRPLPAHLADDGRLTCCWKLTWRERAVIFFKGIIWHQVLTFNQRLQPQLLGVRKPKL